MALLNSVPEPADRGRTGRPAALGRGGPGGIAMATRPLAFGARFRHQGRTLRVHGTHAEGRGFVVEDHRSGRPTRRRAHPSLAEALRDFAASWRARLH